MLERHLIQTESVYGETNDPYDAKVCLSICTEIEFIDLFSTLTLISLGLFVS